MKSLQHFICVFCIYTTFHFPVKAQECGSSIINQNYLQSNPQNLSQNELFKTAAYQRMLNKYAVDRPQPKDRNIYTIPIVVHIIHNNGPENISDAAVQQALDNLNLRFQNAAPFYDPAGNDIGIQFCLASVDTNGNPTTGITRDTSMLTYLNFNATTDLWLKNINRWQPFLYLNIWVVNYITGFSGYAYYPNAAGTNVDGIVISYNAFNSHTLAHEVGHYLNLYHTFENGCINNNCLANGDYVCDTPPDVSNTNECNDNSCNTEIDDTIGLSPFTFDVNNLPNYMDYTSCPNAFTQGQLERMNDALLNTGRSWLLLSNGCGTGPGVPATHAAFNYQIDPCYSGTVSFADTSESNFIWRKWDFNGDGIFDLNSVNNSGTQNPSFTYLSTGVYNVKLVVYGIGGLDSLTQQITVQVASPWHYPLVNYTNIYPGANSWNPTCVGTQATLTAASGMTSYLWSTGATTNSINYTASFSENLWVQATDALGYIWSTQGCIDPWLQVNTTPPAPFIYASDALNNCDGVPIDLHTLLPSGNYNYQWYKNNSPLLGAIDSIYTVVNIGTGAYSYTVHVIDSAGCSAVSNQIEVFISPFPSAAPVITQNGFELTSDFQWYYQWFKDGNPIAGANDYLYNVSIPGCYYIGAGSGFNPMCLLYSDTICYLTVGMQASHTNTEVTISQNSFNEKTIVTFNEIQHNTIIKVLDVCGKEIQVINFSGKACEIENNEMANGVYFLQIQRNSNPLINKKIIID